MQFIQTRQNHPLLATVLVVASILAAAAILVAGTSYAIERGDITAHRSFRTQIANNDEKPDTLVVPANKVERVADLKPEAGKRAGLIQSRQQESVSLEFTALSTNSQISLSLPEQVLLDDVPVGRQTRSLNCEFQSASDLAWYYGQPYTWNEIYRLVGHDVSGNPYRGFVGNSFDDAPGQLYPQGYGVYAEAFVPALAQIGLQTEVHYGESIDWLKSMLSQSQPVMVWATADMRPASLETWTTREGMKISGMRGEHTYLVIGYDPVGVWVSDPWSAERRHFTWNVFTASWDILNRMSLIVTDVSQPEL